MCTVKWWCMVVWQRWGVPGGHAVFTLALIAGDRGSIPCWDTEFFSERQSETFNVAFRIHRNEALWFPLVPSRSLEGAISGCLSEYSSLNTHETYTRTYSVSDRTLDFPWKYIVISILQLIFHYFNIVIKFQYLLPIPLLTKTGEKENEHFYWKNNIKIIDTIVLNLL